MFHDVQFPTGISYNSRGGPGFNTNIIETDSGAEERVQRWSQPRHSYDVKWGIKSLDDLALVRNFYIARNGCAFGFRFKDEMDYTSATNGMGAATNTDQLIGVGTGAALSFQLVKKYTSGPSTVIRTITKPVAGSVTIAFNGVDQPAGWTVDTTTGVVTFAVAPTLGVNVTAGFKFDVPVRFGKEIDSNLPQEIEGFNSGQIPSIPLVEIVDTTQIDGEYPYGGGDSIVSGVSFTLNLLIGRTQFISASAAGVIVTLPNPATLPTGGPLVTLMNVGANTFTVKNHLAVTVVSIAANQAAILSLGVDSGGTPFWCAV